MKAAISTTTEIKLTEEQLEARKRRRSGKVESPDVDPNIPYAQINKDVIDAMIRTPKTYWLAMAIAASIILTGIVIYYATTVYGLQLWGTGESSYWGLDIPAFIYFIGLSHSGTLLSAILLLTKSDWRKPVYRSAEAMTFFAIIAASLTLFMHLGRPWRVFYMLPYPNVRMLWTSWKSALSWDFIAITAYMTTSGLFLVMGSIPDFAAARDRMTGFRKKIMTVLALGWKGTDREWKNLHRAYVVLAALLVPLAASVHSVVAWDWAITNVPGFHSTIFAPFFVAGAIYSGVAGVIIVMVIIRKTLRMQEYIKPYHIDMLAKLLLVVGLVWIYITALEVMVPWLKTSLNNYEWNTLLSKLVGRWAAYYWVMVITCGVIPMSMFSQKVRRNMGAMFFVALSIQVGMFLERFIIIVPGQNTGYIPSRWGMYVPTWVDVSIFLVLAFAVFFILFLFFVKLVPPVSIYEVKELLPIPKRPKGKEIKETPAEKLEPITVKNKPKPQPDTGDS